MKILVADDHNINQILITELLRHLAHDVQVVGDGVQAVDAVRDGRFDLVLKDVRMPLMDGLEATRTICELSGPHRDIAIVALTADGNEPVCRNDYIAAGMNEVLTKPIDLPRLRNMLTRFEPVAP